VQGYADDSEPIGQPGEQTSYYHWPGTGQMYSSPRDMMAFLAANLDELPVDQSLRDAMALAHRNVFRIGPRNWQALAWEDPNRSASNKGGTFSGQEVMAPRRSVISVTLGRRGYAVSSLTRRS
jgi:beta-lactamase class C